MGKIICGIQQMGIGVPDVEKIWKWYRTNFGIDIKVFEDAAEAPLMVKYTGNQVQKRTATLALSMNGGGGFEIWQYTSRNTEKAAFDIQLGDYGLYICKIKSRDVSKSYAFLKANGVRMLSGIEQTPEGKKHFLVEDPNGNIFEIVEGLGWFGNTGHPAGTGGVSGAVIGVSDIEKALPVYRDLLGYTEIVYDTSAVFPVYGNLKSGEQVVRRVLLRHKDERKGPFARLLGPTEIELVHTPGRSDCRKILENRYWGDWGFIHLCFDVQGMETLKKEAEELGYPFTVDSGDTFDMGEAGGRFSYIEDYDGTLLEFVETHKVPILKKVGWYINLRQRNPEKHLPKWMLKTMGLNRVK